LTIYIAATTIYSNSDQYQHIASKHQSHSLNYGSEMSHEHKEFTAANRETWE